MHSFNFWWRLLRPHTLTASFVPVIIGSVYALGFTEHFRFSLFLAMLIASMAIQAGTNLFNEYYDYKRGIDTAESVGIAGAIVHDGASPSFVLNCALACYILAALLGIYICAHSSWLLILIGAFCMLVGYLYTGGPYPISASPFGEVFAGGFLGTGVICISFFLQTHTVTWQCVLISVPTLILIGLILTSNNLRDRVGDEQNGRKTLVILLGHQKSVKFMTVMLAVCYFWPLVLMLTIHMSPAVMLCLFSITPAMKAVKIFTPESQTPAQMMPAMKYIAQTNTVYGLLYAAGLFINNYSVMLL